MAPALIGVDWGTSGFRAFLLDVGGAILDRRSGPHGILTVADGDFAGVLAGQIGAWLGEWRVPVLMSGMIGSRQGWLEAAYLTCPAGLADARGRPGPRALRWRRGPHRARPGDGERRRCAT